MEETFLELKKRFPLRKSQSGKDVTLSARNLHAYLEMNTPYSKWFARRVEE